MKKWLCSCYFRLDSIQINFFAAPNLQDCFIINIFKILKFKATALENARALGNVNLTNLKLLILC